MKFTPTEELSHRLADGCRKLNIKASKMALLELAAFVQGYPHAHAAQTSQSRAAARALSDSPLKASWSVQHERDDEPTYVVPHNEDGERLWDGNDDACITLGRDIPAPARRRLAAAIATAMTSGAISDLPVDKLWCVVHQPHNDSNVHYVVRSSVMPTHQRVCRLLDLDVDPQSDDDFIEIGEAQLVVALPRDSEVIEAIQNLASKLEPEDLDDLVHDTFENAGSTEAGQSAAGINNEGVEAQLTYLFNILGFSEASRELVESVDRPAATWMPQWRIALAVAPSQEVRRFQVRALTKAAAVKAAEQSFYQGTSMVTSSTRLTCQEVQRLS